MHSVVHSCIHIYTNRFIHIGKLKVREKLAL